MNYKPDNEENEILDLIECVKYPGFYYIPSISDLVINKNGDCIRLSNSKKLLKYINDDKYYRVSFRINDFSQHYSIHRLLALTFVGRPKRHWDKTFDELEVNHIDGDKQNNLLNNLEWVTRKENADHANELGLFNKSINVLAKNIYTGEVLTFNSITNCAKEFNIPESTLQGYLNRNINTNYHKNNFIFKLNNSDPWPFFNTLNIKEISNPCVSVLARNLNTNEIIKYKSIKECAEKYNLLPGPLHKHLNSHHAGFFNKDGFVFKFNNSEEWPLIDLKNSKQLGRKSEEIAVMNLETKNIVIYNNIKEVTKAEKVTYSTISRGVRRTNPFIFKGRSYFLIN
jgi:hypothetical protein